MYNSASKTNDEIINNFLSSLSSSGFSKNSVRFYKSDLIYFKNWLCGRIKLLGVFAESFNDTFPFLKKTVGEDYKKYLAEISSPMATVNRKLSSLRKFAGFLLELNLIDFDLAEGLENVTTNLFLKPEKNNSLIRDFESHLINQKASKNTIRNYLADIKHFLTWIDTQYAQS